jgi:hypothetical protein
VVAAPADRLPANTKPEVESYDERKYVCQPGDTDFAAISRRLYNSDKYADALAQYNREHPNGNVAAKQGSRLQPGTEVFVPPIHVLENRYSNAISNTRVPATDGTKPVAPASAPGPLTKMVPVTTDAAAAMTKPPAAPAPGTGSPVPATSTPSNGWNDPPQQPIQPVGATFPAKAAPTPPAANANPAKSGSYKAYTVAAGGQQFYEIARDTLGNGSRWPEIYQLNQQHDPQVLVPAGTQLKLPPDARVGQ